MLWKTYEAFRNRVEYTQNADGSWKAEFHGPVDVVVEAGTLERCRLKVGDALDEKLLEFITAPYNIGSASRSRRSE